MTTQTTLKTELQTILSDWFTNYTSQKPCPAIGFGAETYAQVKEQVFDDLVSNFMREKFGEEWQDNDDAQAFYENTACDLRGDAEYDMQEWIDQYGEFDEKVAVTSIYPHDMIYCHLVEVNYLDRLGDEKQIYFNLDGSETVDDEYRQSQIVMSCFTSEDQTRFDEVVKDIINDKVLGFTPDSCESLFGCSLNDYGVYKYTSLQGEIAVVVRKYYQDIAYDDKSKHFDNEEDFKAWSDEMYQDDHYQDANVVYRAINDIEGHNDY